MTALERQKRIEEILLERKHISVAELSNIFGVSFETVRRDLKAMEKIGLIEKSYGEARIKEKVSHELGFEELSHIMVDAKKKISEAAMRYVEPGDCLYLDYATTCLMMVDYLGEVPVTVMTSSFEVLKGLTSKPKVHTYCTGGSWDEKNRAFVGQATLKCLDDFHLDKAFISCRALSMEKGLSDRTEIEAALRRKVIEASNEVYLMVDYSKFDKEAFVRTADFSKLKGIITDAELGEEWQEFLEERGITYINCYRLPDETELF
ncbi:MAG: DeoR/GlpR family DNA-binding transcription regulator [Firmicutes bacterium]|nr:DeoR/GlpR family DNA-binding transcription regulator [Bacillota bacterium]